MNWTKDKPTVPGFYWHRSPEREPSVIEVIDNLGELCVAFTQGVHDWLSLNEKPMYGMTPDLSPDSEWAGPLEPPQ